jgi:hypothetical protein
MLCASSLPQYHPTDPPPLLFLLLLLLPSFSLFTHSLTLTLSPTRTQEEREKRRLEREANQTPEEKEAAEAQRAKMEAWRAKHGDAVVVPLVRQALADIRAAHPGQKVGAIGFCWGGRYSILTAGGTPALVDAFAAAHPSRVQVPVDIEAIEVQFPLGIFSHHPLPSSLFLLDASPIFCSVLFAVMFFFSHFTRTSIIPHSLTSAQAFHTITTGS